ncbi:hypothetical protein F9278_36210 [Streptomyces phaeolivaceus]|uniref:Uncharacterized protein n=1 Tax=Streptomyces phaeolivaceus TaxID=2653200 RepID=A0A5P8KCI9_9ACTN|nr:hypothetical protein [Streptomyces phaeolivaceus]QFR00725.1 hypothetical protein F9278_36210 [Streptomyces phaeolivaceus]
MHAPLPVHPRTGLTAVGWRKARPHHGEDEGELYPIWPILGGAPDEDDDDQDDDAGADDGDDEGDDDGQDDDAGDGDDGQDDDGAGDQDGQDDADPDGADQLGDKGKRALASMKGKWRSERDKRRDLERQLAGKGNSGDDAVAKATAAATAKANARILKAEIRAAAAKKLADPRDALRFLDLGQFEVDDEGEVDAEEIADAIETLIKDKPYLAAATAKPRFQGSGDGGAARKAGRPKQLTERDLKNMSAEQIVKAQEEGKLDDLLGA